MILREIFEWLIGAKCRLARRKMLHERKTLFSHIITRLFMAPNVVDIKFGQDVLLKEAKITEQLVDLEAGILYLTVNSQYEGRAGQHSYSLYFTGDMLRIGLLLCGDLANAVLIDWHNELQSIWPGCSPQQIDRKGVTMYEWTFILPELYTNPAVQERYILGMRHMHSRLLRIIADYHLMQANEGK